MIELHRSRVLIDKSQAAMLHEARTAALEHQEHLGLRGQWPARLQRWTTMLLSVGSANFRIG